ncbi:hypothetical protein V8B97DRAFT_2005619 [Scleroderma yunnanense]
MPDKKPTSSADASLHGFLERTRAWEDPSAVYIFDGERGAPRSEICREDLTVGQQAGQGKLKECVVLEMYPTQLFEAMQVSTVQDRVAYPKSLCLFIQHYGTCCVFWASDLSRDRGLVVDHTSLKNAAR